MQPNERKDFYQKLIPICEELSNSKQNAKTKLLSSIINGVSKLPYAVVAFLYLFKYMHLLEVNPIAEVNYEVHLWDDDIFLINDDKDLAHDLAVNFDKVWESEMDTKRQYRDILLAYIERGYYGEPRVPPANYTWDAIKTDDSFDFRSLIEPPTNKWLLLNTRNSHLTRAFEEAVKDIRVKKLGLKKWKAAHLWWYHGRQIMIDDIVSGKYIWSKYFTKFSFWKIILEKY